MTSKIVEQLIALLNCLFNTMNTPIDEITFKANGSATIYFHNSKLQ